jgi:hypothetical protein
MAKNLLRRTGVAAAIAMGGVFLAGTMPAHAQVATSLEKAELAGLSPAVHAEVAKRMKQPGQTVYEILQTVLLNSIKLKFPAGKILALDFNRGAATVQTSDGQIKVVDFDTRTLELKA